MPIICIRKRQLDGEIYKPGDHYTGPRKDLPKDFFKQIGNDSSSKTEKECLVEDVKKLLASDDHKEIVEACLKKHNVKTVVKLTIAQLKEAITECAKNIKE